MTTTAKDEKLRPRSGRTPLKPINSPVTPITATKLKPKPKPKPEQECIDKNQNQNQIPAAADLNKEESENKPVTNIDSLDTSLAEELSAIRKKLERLRLEKERTEKMLDEREVILDMQMKGLQNRGEIQKMLEIEVDRLYRLNQLKSYCIRVSSIRSLREKEQEKKTTAAANSQEPNAANEEESEGENILESPCSTASEIVEREIIFPFLDFF
ncbi:hypothetical protein WN944_004394 [Citrus x changshan-huyou]|uniref:Myelin transcription factor n=4 Tax=Citrus TaxID=2706 RepID=A0ACB8JWP2_CITSI|nr:Myelin transcription factor [Citrus sinensis]